MSKTIKCKRCPTTTTDAHIEAAGWTEHAVTLRNGKRTVIKLCASCDAATHDAEGK